MSNIYALPKYHKKKLTSALQVRAISFIAMLERANEHSVTVGDQFDSWLFRFNKLDERASRQTEPGWYSFWGRARAN